MNSAQEGARSTRIEQIAIKRRWTGACVMLTLACMVPLFAVLTWPLGEETMATRYFAKPILFAEALLVCLAIADGFRPLDSFRALGPATRIFAIGWIVSASLSMLAARSAPGLAAILFACTLLHGLAGLAFWNRALAGWREWQDGIYASLALGMAGYLAIAAGCVAAVLHDAYFPWVYFGVGVSNVRQIGFYGLVLTGLAGGLIGSGSRVLPPLVLAGLLLAGWFLVEWSGGRAAFGAAICAAGALVALSRGRRRRVLAFSVACAVVAIPLSDAAAPSPRWGPGSIWGRVIEQTDDFSSGRSEIWAETWHRIREAPLLGHGQGQFREEVRSVRKQNNHPHNALLQFLYEWGWIGTLLLGTMLLRSGITVLRAPLERLRPGLPAIGAGVGLLAMSSLEGSLYHAFPVMVVAICWALIVANAGRGAITSALPRSSPGTPPAAALARDL